MKTDLMTRLKNGELLVLDGGIGTEKRPNWEFKADVSAEYYAAEAQKMRSA